MSETAPSPDLLYLTACIVSAHASHNSVAADALPALIRAVYAALENANIDSPEGVQLRPAVPVKKSVFPDYIVCLEDGKQFKMLKRHLFTRYKMTPQQYRQKWGLPDNYPMVASNYAAYRSTLARGIGLGRAISREEPPSLGSGLNSDPDFVPVRRVPEGVRGKRLLRTLADTV